MSVRANTLANFLGQASIAVLNLVFIPIYIVFLGMEAYGLIGLLAAMQAWLTFFDLGMTPTLNREMARYKSGEHSVQTIRNLLASLEVVAIVIAVFFGIALWFLSDYLSRDWLKPGNLPITAISEALSFIALIISLRFIEGIYRGALLGLQEQVWLNISGVIIITVRNGGAALIVSLISPTTQAFFAWQLLFSILTVLTLALRVHLIIPKSSFPTIFFDKSTTQALTFTKGMIGIGFVALLLSQVDKLLLSRLLSLEAFGYYSLAANIAGLSYVIVGSVTTAVFPLMVQHSAPGHGMALAKVYHQGAQLVTVFTAPFAMILFFYSEGAIFVWSGDVSLALQTGPILSVLALGYFLNGLMWMPYQCQIAQGWLGLVFKGNLLGVLLLVPAIFWLVPLYGAVGSAWIWVVLNIGYILLIIPFMHRKLMPMEGFSWYMSDVLFPLSGTIGVTVLAFFFRPEQYIDRGHWFVFLLASGSSAVIVAAILAKQMRGQLSKLIHIS